MKLCTMDGLRTAHVNPATQAALARAARMLDEVFGSPELRIEAWQDPESSLEATIPFLIVRTELDVNEATALMDGFLDSWLLSEDVDVPVEFSLEFT